LNNDVTKDNTRKDNVNLFANNYENLVDIENKLKLIFNNSFICNPINNFIFPQSSLSSFNLQNNLNSNYINSYYSQVINRMNFQANYNYNNLFSPPYM